MDRRSRVDHVDSRCKELISHSDDGAAKSRAGNIYTLLVSAYVHAVVSRLLKKPTSQLGERGGGELFIFNALVGGHRGKRAGVFVLSLSDTHCLLLYLAGMLQSVFAELRQDLNIPWVLLDVGTWRRVFGPSPVSFSCGGGAASLWSLLDPSPVARTHFVKWRSCTWQLGISNSFVDPTSPVSQVRPCRWVLSHATFTFFCKIMNLYLFFCFRFFLSLSTPNLKSQAHALLLLRYPSVSNVILRGILLRRLSIAVDCKQELISSCCKRWHISEQRLGCNPSTSHWYWVQPV